MVKSIYEKEGSDCWFSDDPQRFLGKKYKANEYEKLSDIVEVWFDSGSTHSFVLEKRDDLKWPASMYLEGSDQHRGWFHSSLLESCGTRGRAPFESILSHGFVVDGKGLKMSKSLGNVIAPEDILKKYGADILRIWVASSNYSEDLRIDYSILDQHADSYRKIRNTFRYLLGNINDKFEIIENENKNTNSFGRLKAFHGQVGMFIRAYSYILSHGSDGLKQVAEDAVLNANYIQSKLKEHLTVKYPGFCMHEVLFDDQFLKGTEVSTLDFAKAMIDKGIHPMTIYFPLIASGAMLTEPTETESKKDLDNFCEKIIDLAKKAKEGNRNLFSSSPTKAVLGRLNETAAARDLILTYSE